MLLKAKGQENSHIEKETEHYNDKQSLVWKNDQVKPPDRIQNTTYAHVSKRELAAIRWIR